MDTEPTDKLTQHQFFITPPHSCSYLDDKEATTLFLDPRETVTSDLYSNLTDMGFRRSGGHLYRPHCDDCRACVPVRIPVQQFAARRRHRRIANRNADLRVVMEPAQFLPKYFELYERYITGRHRDGDMYPANADQFRSFLLSSWANTEFLCGYLGTDLVFVGALDKQRDGYSAIYTFFEPELPQRSLGVYSVLQQIAYCQRTGVNYLYLGYWIKECQKMSYKTDYRPLELMVNNRWALLR